MALPSGSVEAPQLTVAPLAVIVPDETVGAPGSVGGWFAASVCKQANVTSRQTILEQAIRQKSDSRSCRRKGQPRACGFKSEEFSRFGSRDGLCIRPFRQLLLPAPAKTRKLDFQVWFTMSFMFYFGGGATTALPWCYFDAVRLLMSR
jgi:hypothetical protein